jgi:hypothetical protein
MHGGLVAYSITLPDGRVSSEIVRQLEISFSSLRAANRTQPVVLFSYGPLPAVLARLCRTHDVMVSEQIPYEQRLRRACRSGWPALARYPLLHKYLNFSSIAGNGYEQVLCCDCDTVFAGDVAELFRRYGWVAPVVAREEIHSSRSPYGYDPAFIDEQQLARLGAATGVTPLAPFNLGVVLFNRIDWGELAAIEDRFIDIAWRLATWMAMHPVGPDHRYAEFQGLREAAATMTADDIARALPFPSANRWILDEVALWLTLGHLRSVTNADFSPDDVAQNGEFARSDPRCPPWILCHYFSHSLERVEAWRRSAA